MDEIAADHSFSYAPLRERIKRHQVSGVDALGVTSSERGTAPAHVRQNPRLHTEARVLVLVSWTAFVLSVSPLARLMTR